MAERVQALLHYPAHQTHLIIEMAIVGINRMDLLTQNFSRNSAGDRMGMSRNGWSTNRSLSPDTMQLTLVPIASFRNLISLMSRQFTESSWISVPDFEPSRMVANLGWRKSISTYLSNLVLPITSVSSFLEASEKTRTPISCATCRTRLLLLFSSRMALIKTFLSRINTILFYFTKNPSKISFSSRVNWLMVTESTLASASSMASSNFSEPDGYCVPASIAFNVREARFWRVAKGSFFQLPMTCFSILILMVSMMDTNVGKANKICVEGVVIHL